MVKAGKVYATATEDMDALTFGTNILLRHLTFSEARKMPVQEFFFDKVLQGLEFSKEQVSVPFNLSIQNTQRLISVLLLSFSQTVYRSVHFVGLWLLWINSRHWTKTSCWIDYSTQIHWRNIEEYWYQEVYCTRTLELWKSTAAIRWASCSWSRDRWSKCQMLKFDAKISDFPG